MDTHRFNLVIPLDLWEQIQELAERNRRSITAEILVAIELHLKVENNNFLGPTTMRELRSMDAEKMRQLLGTMYTLQDIRDAFEEE